VKKLILASLLSCLAIEMVNGGLKPGDPAAPFSLKGVDGTMVSLSDYNTMRGVILVFTSNPCPFSNAYEKRIIELHNRYADLGFPVIAINSNNPDVSPDDSFSQMKRLSDEKKYPFPYLKDENAQICEAYGATRNPQVFLLEKGSTGFQIAYVGAIDDNSLDARSVSNNYLDNAIINLMKGTKPDPATTKPIGCMIKSNS
jgi:peroxiredoxin